MDTRVGHTCRATVEYDGTEYAGFQLQRDRRTIQGELEQALKRVSGQAARVHGAGRTDAGVHARGQVISFRVAWAHPLGDLPRAMNAVLPRDIAVRGLAVASDGFHARYSARSRVYRYRVYGGAVRSPLLDRHALYERRPLDVGAMSAAAACLVGRHDLAAFGQSPTGGSTVREVYVAKWSTAGQPEVIEFEIEANAFLRGMVRRIVGSLLQVGSGVLTAEGLAQVLGSRDIARTAVRVPACGLCLERVTYGDEERDQDDALCARLG